MAELAYKEWTGIPIFAIELDDLTLERLRVSVRGSELALCPVSRDEAVERASTSAAPIIALLEWIEGDEQETERLCEALRRGCHPNRCHIVALGGGPDPVALFRALEGPVDDVLSRPFGGDLAVRLRQALRAAQNGGVRSCPRDALEEALQSPTGGEVAVRSGETTAYIHVQAGHVVWAHVSSLPASMEEVLRHAGVDLDHELTVAVKEESRASGAHFMEVLVTWGLIDEPRAREAVREFVAGRVEAALALPDAVGLFLPRSRPRTERLRFRASEIPSLRVASAEGPVSARFDVGPPSQSRAPLLPLGEIVDIVQQAIAIDGAVGAAVLDRKSGASLFHEGVEMDTAVAWSQLTTLAALGAAAEDVMAMAEERCFVTRPLRFAASLVLFVAFALPATTVGMARMSIGRLTRQRATVEQVSADWHPAEG